MLKLPSKCRPFWPLVRVVDTFPNEERVICTVRVAKLDNSEVVVNVSYLIPSELYSELNNPNVYGDISSQEEIPEELEENVESSDIENSEFGSSIRRPSRKTAEASRAQIVNLACRRLL